MPGRVGDGGNGDRIAITALFVALGAADNEIDPAVEILRRHSVPLEFADIARQAREALTLHRIERAGT